ncbi:MAG: moderate conductance mechanosensitive channel [Rhodospirillaceae bacterium]|jgi:small conductance mechanosensitive channel|nr:moderate conductance mechanosensitive channel [Rhodospirillaceae bacterium]
MISIGKVICGRAAAFLRWPALACILAVVLALTCAPAGADSGVAGAPAATPAASAPNVSSEDLKALLATLKNDTERQKLIAKIEALMVLRQQPASAAIAPAGPHTSPPPAPAAATTSGTPGAEAIASASEQIRRVSEALVAGAGTIFNVPELVDWTQRQVGDEATRLSWLELLLKLAIVLAVAIIAGRLLNLVLRRPRRSMADRESTHLGVRLVLLLLRILFDLLAIGAFGAAAYVVLPFTNPSNLARIITLAVVNATVILRAILAVARAILAPPGARLQFLAMSDETASYWYVWLRRLIGVTICGYFAVDAALLVGLPRTGYEFLLRALGLVLAALAIILVLQNRTSVAHVIHGRDRQERATGLKVLRARIADIWHVLALLYVVAIYVVWAIQVPGGFDFILRGSVISVIVLVGARILTGSVDDLLRRFFAVGRDLKQRFPGLEERAGRYMPILSAGLRVIIYVGAGLILLEAWGFGSFDWLRSDFGRGLIADLATIAITVVVAVAIWETFLIGTDFYLARQTAETRPALRRARARTLLPLLRRTVSIVLIIFVSLIALAEIGVNIAPLLAGAGVIGIAIGFGAQTFVKDLINGLHLLFEDTLVVGDSVTIGADSGVVEAITMRTIRLRDGNGAVRTIPFSEITRVINASRDFGVAAFEIPIAFREDIDRAIAAIQAVGTELKDDPVLGRDMLEPLLNPFIDRFTEYAVILKTNIKTLPGRNGAIAQAFNMRLKRHFDALGIEMPYPSRRLYVESKSEASKESPDKRRGGGAQASAVAAAKPTPG